MNSGVLNRINVLVKKTYYAYERYDVDATFALLYHDKPLDVEKLSEYVRISDHLIQVDDHHYFIIFTFTEQKNAYKASQNIVHNLDTYFNDTASCIALDTFDGTKSGQNVLNRLKQILAEIRKSPYIRVEIEDILDTL